MNTGCRRPPARRSWLKSVPRTCLRVFDKWTTIMLRCRCSGQRPTSRPHLLRDCGSPNWKAGPADPVHLG